VTSLESAVYGGSKRDLDEPDRRDDPVGQLGVAVLFEARMALGAVRGDRP
jgi:hypothetical protein